MNTVEKYISPLLKSQFPDFYKEQGPLFILFCEEYFKWLEGNENASYTDALLDGNPIYHARRLAEYRDIDKTVDEFLVYFKEKYLKNVNISTNVSKKRLVKASHDIFSSKGSERSLDLFFKLVYGTKVEIYYPGEDIFKASDGTWVLPVYLELSRSSRTLNFPGKQIYGSVSGATALVEYIITRNINGKIVDIAFLSSVNGTFVTGEQVRDSDSIVDAPKIIGSLSGLSITAGGELFTVGEIVKIVSSRGVEGKALITAIESVTGLVRFSIVDGGWGFSNTTAETIVSEKVIRVSNVYNTNTEITEFARNETLTQNLYSFALTDISGTFTVGNRLRNGNTSTFSISTLVSTTQNSTSVSTANVTLNQISGNVFSNSIIYDINKSIISTNTNVVFEVGDTLVQANSTSNNVVGIVSAISNVVIITANTSTIGSNGIHVGTYAVQNSTGATGYVSIIPRENLFTFTNVSSLSLSSTNGTFSNTDVITLYPDSSNSTVITTFDPTLSIDGYQYQLVQTNLLSNTRWSSSNTVIKQGSPSVNNVILIASDVGGIYTSSSNVSATANLFASNTTHIGLTSVTGTFYAVGNSVVVSSTSNTIANSVTIYTGTGADFEVGVLENAETVRVSPDFISSNNDGPGSNSTQFSEMLITGANSTYGYATAVIVFDSGTGYDNTDIVVFSGGNTATGYEIANGSVLTDASGNIVSVSLTANTGSEIESNPTVTIANSSGGSTSGSGANVVPVFSYGFVKLPGGDATARILDLLRFSNKTIGGISTLAAINPGEDYNIDPFVLIYEPEIAAYGKKDIILEYNTATGAGFIVGEYVEQTINTPAIEITSNTYSGNTSLAYEVEEVVYSTDGISNVATGIVYSHSRDLVTNVHTTVLSSNSGSWQNTIAVSVLTVSSNTSFSPGDDIVQSSANGILVTSNTTTLIVKDVNGTFAANSTTVTSNSGGSTLISAESNTSIYTLIGLTSNSVSYVQNTSPYTASTLTRAIIKSNANNQTLFLKRVNLFTEFNVGSTIVGKSTGTTANVLSVNIDESTNDVGDNAVISANVVASEGTISQANIIDSGYGYENAEGVSLISLDGLRAASAQANVATQGIGTGYYSSTRGFTDNNKYIIDSDYYQNYSYEVQTQIPLDQYFDTLKQVLHVSGKKLFGRVVATPSIDFNTTGSTSVEIT